MDGIGTAIQEADKRKFTILGREFAIGKFSILQTTRLTQFVVKVAVKYTDYFKQLAKKESSSMDDLMGLISVLNEDQVAELIGIFLNTKDYEFCKKLPVEDVTEVIAEVCENNDMPRILKNVQRAVRAWKGQR